MASPDPAPEPTPRRGPPFIVIGALLALLAGAAIAFVLVSGDRGRTPPPPTTTKTKTKKKEKKQKKTPPPPPQKK